MQKVEIYTGNFCGFCVAAKRLLDSKNVAYTEFNVATQPDLRGKMIARANGRRTVPQIFIGAKHVGGCNELFALERAGSLDPLLGR